MWGGFGSRLYSLISGTKDLNVYLRQEQIFTLTGGSLNSIETPRDHLVRHFLSLLKDSPMEEPLQIRRGFSHFGEGFSKEGNATITLPQHQNSINIDDSTTPQSHLSHDKSHYSHFRILKFIVC